MEITKLIETVKSDSSFDAFTKECPNNFLAHIFLMEDGDTLRDVQIGFYDDSSKKMTSFAVVDGNVVKMPPQDVFQKPGAVVRKLDTEKIKHPFEDVKEGVEKLISEKYAVSSTKKIFILQNLEVGQVWNVTYLTTKFSTVNVKVDTETMEIISDEEVQLIDMGMSK